jgi:hypothetical protein
LINSGEIKKISEAVAIEEKSNPENRYEEYMDEDW